MPSLRAVDHLHKGSHPKFLQEVVEIDGGDFYRWLCRSVFFQLVEARPDNALDLSSDFGGNGMGCMFLCDWGKHRSVACLILILWCFLQVGWDVNRYWHQLNLKWLSENKCGHAACPDHGLCYTELHEYQGSYLQDALDIFLEASQSVLFGRD